MARAARHSAWASEAPLKLVQHCGQSKVRADVAGIELPGLDQGRLGFIGAAS